LSDFAEVKALREIAAVM